MTKFEIAGVRGNILGEKLFTPPMFQPGEQLVVNSLAPGLRYSSVSYRLTKWAFSLLFFCAANGDVQKLLDDYYLSNDHFESASD